MVQKARAASNLDKARREKGPVWNPKIPELEVSWWPLSPGPVSDVWGDRGSEMLDELSEDAYIIKAGLGQEHLAPGCKFRAFPVHTVILPLVFFWRLFLFTCFWRPLSGSVSWMSDSWFPLRSWSQERGIEPPVGLHAQCGVWLSLSFSFTPPLIVLSLSQINT